MFQRIERPTPRQGAALLAAAGGGLLGLLPGNAGALDPVTFFAWTLLLAPAAGALLAGVGVRLFPFALSVPALWMAVLVGCDLGSTRDFATPLYGGAFLAGIFALGFTVGALGMALGARQAPGFFLLLGIVLSGLPVQAGLAAGGESWARERPGLARALLAASPLVAGFDCAGWDWTHSNPLMYRLSGVEWFPRAPLRAELAGPAVLVVGCALAAFAGRRSRGGPRPGSSST